MQLYAVKQVTVVADAGLMSSDNQTWLSERGMPYIQGFRVKTASAALKRQMLEPDGFESFNSGGRRGETVCLQCEPNENHYCSTPDEIASNRNNDI